MATKAGSILYQSFEDKKWTLAIDGTGIVSQNSNKELSSSFGDSNRTQAHVCNAMYVGHVTWSHMWSAVFVWEQESPHLENLWYKVFLIKN